MSLDRCRWKLLRPDDSGLVIEPMPMRRLQAANKSAFVEAQIHEEVESGIAATVIPAVEQEEHAGSSKLIIGEPAIGLSASDAELVVATAVVSPEAPVAALDAIDHWNPFLWGVDRRE